MKRRRREGAMEEGMEGQRKGGKDGGMAGWLAGMLNSSWIMRGICQSQHHHAAAAPCRESWYDGQVRFSGLCWSATFSVLVQHKGFKINVSSIGAALRCD